MSLESLSETVALFEHLPKETRIEGLISLAGEAGELAPRAGERFDVEDVRQDIECLDVVGLYARLEAGNRVRLAATVGPEVTTLTRAMVTLLVKNLDGETLDGIDSVQRDSIERVVGEALMRQRSNTGFVVLRRLHELTAALRRAQRPVA
ncbi:MAG TPA: hypothetical protein VHN99_05775 [Deinococcales bacterium]|nr:hypothetical protein [Deinococcales bacterium]